MDANRSSEKRPKAGVKKPYQKPSFRYERAFVTTAMSCTKVAGRSRECNASPSAS